MWATLLFYACHIIEKVHPLQGGLFRRIYRLDRRPTFPIENSLIFYPRYFSSIIGKHARFLLMFLRAYHARRRVERDPARHDYMDMALMPAEEHDLDELAMFTSTEFGQHAVDKMRKQHAIKSAISAAK